MNQYWKFFFREELKKLIGRVNEEKRVIKENGIVVDGNSYKINFKGAVLYNDTLIFFLTKKQ